MYAPMYWPKGGIRTGCNDYNIKFCKDLFVSRLTNVTAQPADCTFPSVAAQYVTYRVPIKLANYFWRLSSMDLFVSNQCAHLKIFCCVPCLVKCGSQNFANAYRRSRPLDQYIGRLMPSPHKPLGLWDLGT